MVILIFSERLMSDPGEVWRFYDSPKSLEEDGDICPLSSQQDIGEQIQPA